MIAVTGILAGCGTVAAGTSAGSGSAGSGSAGSGNSGKSANAPKAAPPKISLTVSVIHETAKPKHFVLHCLPTGGNVPDAQSLCKALIAMKKPFTPPFKHMMCPMIIISDHTITVSGTWFGQKVSRVITDGGCDLGIFNTLDKVLH